RDQIQRRRLGQANSQRFPQRVFKNRIAGGIRKIADQNGIGFRKFRAALRIPVESSGHKDKEQSCEGELGPHEQRPLLPEVSRRTLRSLYEPASSHPSRWNVIGRSGLTSNNI